MVGGHRKNPRARQGADVKIGPAAKSSSPGCRDRGSGSYDPTGYEVGRECPLSVRPELAETKTWHLTCRPSYEGFGRPAPGPVPPSQRAVAQNPSPSQTIDRLPSTRRRLSSRAETVRCRSFSEQREPVLMTLADIRLRSAVLFKKAQNLSLLLLRSWRP